MQKPMSVECKRQMIRVAKGEESAELVLKNATYLNVFTESWEKGDIAIAGGHIAGIGHYSGSRERDVSGMRVVPGLIDGHIHLESSLLTPPQFAQAILPHGTTAVVSDPHEMANVLGIAGIRYMLEATEGLPVDVYVMLPSCVPATGEDESFETLTAEALEPLWQHPRVLGLAEMMNYPGVLGADEQVLKKIVAAENRGKPVDGHAPCLKGAELTAYIAAGIATDHECSTYEEGMEKLAQGQWIMIREGTAAQNMSALLPLLRAPYAARCLFVTDDKHPAELLHDGHLDGIVRLAVERGADPILAFKAATYNTAQAFGLRGRGAVAAGYAADLVLMDDAYFVQTTMKDGKIVFDGQVPEVTAPKVSEELLQAALHSFHMAPITEHAFCKTGALGVLAMVQGQIITTDGGMAEAVNVQADILKIAVLERHHHTGHVGVGYLRGYGLQHGAVATSVAHDSHNLIVVGDNDADMACAAERVRVLEGGIVLVRDGQILGELPLPIAGLMTDWDMNSVNEQMEKCKKIAADMGVHSGVDPFMTLSFMSLPVIPAMRILTHGVFDVTHWRYASK
ncbi:MAG: adenine deaminase [Clostridia bacterium]